MIGKERANCQSDVGWNTSFEEFRQDAVVRDIIERLGDVEEHDHEGMFLGLLFLLLSFVLSFFFFFSPVHGLTPLSQNVKRERLRDCASADSESRLGRMEEAMSLRPRSQAVPEDFLRKTEPSGEERDWAVIRGV